ncbi:MAG: XdhC/CoxI family protein [Acidobacteriota bacterium]
MMKMDILKELKEIIEKDKEVVIATVIDAKGSTPRRIGAKMIIKRDGTIVSSVGGGLAEAEVIKAAEEIFEGGNNRVLELKFYEGKEAKGVGICGGKMQVFLEKIDSLEWINLLMENREEELISGTVITCENVENLFPGERVLIKKNGSFVKDSGNNFINNLIQKEMLESSIKSFPYLSTLNFEDKRVTIFFESFFEKPEILIMGAGHVGMELYKIAKNFNFKIVILDDRKDFANRERFPEADEIICDSWDGMLKNLKINSNSFCVLVNREHSLDQKILKNIVEKEAAYIGMIGSRRKINTIFETLKKEGISEIYLKKVRSPIGIDIGAESPEEIALSIMAEIIKIKNKRDKEITFLKRNYI